MKKFYTVILLSITLGSGAQEIVDSSKIWSNLTGYCHPDHTVYTTEYYKFGSDTVIDGKNYQLVYISEDEFHEEWFFFGAFIREESWRVYYRDYSGEEGLIYDFNLELGDTVTINNPRVPDSVVLTLTEIDSVETPQGYRDRWKLTGEGYTTPEYWVRGVGSLSGVINSTSVIFGGLCGQYILLCAQKNDTIIYQNPDYDSCYYEELIVGENKSQVSGPEYNIRYLPDNRSVELFFSAKEKHTIMITDIQGRLVEKTTTTGDRLRISLLNHARGLYVVTIVTKGEVPVSRKMMIY